MHTNNENVAYECMSFDGSSTIQNGNKQQQRQTNKASTSEENMWSESNKKIRTRKKEPISLCKTVIVWVQYWKHKTQAIIITMNERKKMYCLPVSSVSANVATLHYSVHTLRVLCFFFHSSSSAFSLFQTVYQLRIGICLILLIFSNNLTEFVYEKIIHQHRHCQTR